MLRDAIRSSERSPGRSPARCVPSTRGGDAARFIGDQHDLGGVLGDDGRLADQPFLGQHRHVALLMPIGCAAIDDDLVVPGGSIAGDDPRRQKLERRRARW